MLIFLNTVPEISVILCCCTVQVDDDSTEDVDEGTSSKVTVPDGQDDKFVLLCVFLLHSYSYSNKSDRSN